MDYEGIKMMYGILCFIKNNIGEIASFAEIVGVFLVVATLLHEKRVKQIEFASEYNFHFLSSPELSEFERRLEGCNQKYNYKERSGYFNTSEFSHKEYKHIQQVMDSVMAVGKVQDSSEPVTREYQKMVNYLVYLESFAPLLLKKRVKYQDIDDLFGYRFFIAMNNPIVQERELLPEAMYYRGCIKLYKKWYKYRIKRKLSIPMNYFSLTRWKSGANDRINPVFEFDNHNILLDNYLSIAHPLEWKKRVVIRGILDRLTKISK